MIYTSTSSRSYYVAPRETHYQGPEFARRILLRTSEFIRKNPRKFSFTRISIPGNTAQVGCALGWIGYFAREEGVQSKWWTCQDAIAVIDAPSCQKFYDRMGTAWTVSGRITARRLRWYANKYFPDPNYVPFRTRLLEFWKATVELVSIPPLFHVQTV